MSLIKTIHGATSPNWLASAECKRVKTATAHTSMGTEDKETHRVIVASGTVYPANDSTAEGIVFSDVDVTYGDYPCAVMTSGYVFEDRLPVTLTAEAKAALQTAGIKLEKAPEFERLYK